MKKVRQVFLFSLLVLAQDLYAQSKVDHPGTRSRTRLINVDSGWARNTVNVTVFRKNSLVTFKDTQFIAFYNPQRYVVLGKRKIGESKWILKQTQFQGNTTDAHNVISIMVDGDGVLHMAWDHHNNPLRYAKGIAPGSIEMTGKISMTGNEGNSVSYPEFYKLADGSLLFLFRDGGSGNGNLVINRYDIKKRQWTTVQRNLISGEGKRNAYWQTFVDGSGVIHLSWVWRESPNVASNHDLAYARSTDGGISWQRSNGGIYTLPITASTAEYAARIPQNSELINQTSMYADEHGEPFIATYWRDSGTTVPQYHIVYLKKGRWKVSGLGFRKTPFTLNGGGSKRIPVARPQVMSDGKKVYMVFRDEERGSKVSVAYTKDIGSNEWKILDLTHHSVGSWEPSFDTELWKSRKQLHLFVQKAVQVDGEGLNEEGAEMVRVVEWKREGGRRKEE